MCCNLLSDQPDGMRASDLARALIVDRSNVTGLIKRMKKDGLLKEGKPCRTAGSTS